MNALSRCGFVALVGRPNVGKSTLMNHLIGEKLSITSRRPQTTRHSITGIYTQGDDQILFVDTPGLELDSKRALNRYMRRVISQVLSDVDVVVMVIDRNRWNQLDEAVAERLQELSCKILLAINKIDLMADKTPLLPFMQERTLGSLFQAMVPVSALKKDGLDLLIKEICTHLPQGQQLFPADQLTDKSDRFRAAEVIREQIIRQVGDEIPYETTVELEAFVQEDQAVSIRAAIITERAGQKGILIGHQGERIRSISRSAQTELSKLLCLEVELELWVKVRKGWSHRIDQIKGLGYGDAGT